MNVVAIGGGHGTAVTLQALRRLSNAVTGVVSVADNGGSSGRLREMMDVAAVGDLRKCLVALACPNNELATVFEHRFSRGDLQGHPLGNLLLVGLLDADVDLVDAVALVGRLLNITGDILPASTKGVTLIAQTDGGRTEGQVQVAAAANVRRISTQPDFVRAPKQVVAAIENAQLVVIGPGSLYTSLIAACVVPGIREALRRTKARRVYVANLRDQERETTGMSLRDHVDSLRDHGICFDLALVSANREMDDGIVNFPLVEGELTGANARVHDASKLAACLSGLVA
jgi:uncharacterized cofD-like protein